jgi:hypothetical protein
MSDKFTNLEDAIRLSNEKTIETDSIHRVLRLDACTLLVVNDLEHAGLYPKYVPVYVSPRVIRRGKK